MNQTQSLSESRREPSKNEVELQYCRTCILPNTRPGLSLDDDGVCNACRDHSRKVQIDWDARRKDLETIIEQSRSKTGGYDCIIPVSGGKDSTWQVIKCKEYGLNILAVTWRTPGRTRIGQQNLDNLIGLGVDHIDYSIDPRVERVFTLKSFEKTGSTAVAMHMALCSIPLRLAVAMNIPLVVWGESPQMEYGADEDGGDRNQLNHDWCRRHGILQNTTPEDWIDDELTRSDLTPYFLPDEADFKSKNIKSIFLGYYLPWDPEQSLKVSLANGFRVREEGPKVGYYNYADIDCDFISVHHYFKWLKFGFTRLFDNLSIEIRNGRLTREEAMDIAREYGSQYPDEDIERLCEFLQISRERFSQTEERYRNHDIWEQDNGVWKIKNFFIPDWRWT